jgi:hypothetical protein
MSDRALFQVQCGARSALAASRRYLQPLRDPRAFWGSSAGWFFKMWLGFDFSVAGPALRCPSAQRCKSSKFCKVCRNLRFAGIWFAKVCYKSSFFCHDFLPRPERDYEHRLRVSAHTGLEPGTANAGPQKGRVARRSSAKRCRAPEFQRMLDQLRRGDTVIREEARPFRPLEPRPVGDDGNPYAKPAPAFSRCPNP